MNSHYGFCPICGSPGVSRERRINENDICEQGHKYLSRDRFNTYEQFLQSEGYKKMDNNAKIQQKINELQQLISNDEISEYNILVDRSGSMATIKDHMKSGFHEWLNEEKKLPGKSIVNFYQFDSDFEIVYEGKSLDTATFQLEPRGLTALNDAIGRVVTLAKERHRENKPQKVMFIIITDGGENSSREWTASSVKNLVEQETRQKDYVFLYIGTNQDAVLTGKDRGISAGKHLNYTSDAAGVKGAWKDISRGTSKLRCSSMQSYKAMSDGTEAVFDSSESKPEVS